MFICHLQWLYSSVEIMYAQKIECMGAESPVKVFYVNIRNRHLFLKYVFLWLKTTTICTEVTTFWRSSSPKAHFPVNWNSLVWIETHSRINIIQLPLCLSYFPNLVDFPSIRIKTNTGTLSLILGNKSAIFILMVNFNISFIGSSLFAFFTRWVYSQNVLNIDHYSDCLV